MKPPHVQDWGKGKAYRRRYRRRLGPRMFTHPLPARVPFSSPAFMRAYAAADAAYEAQREDRPAPTQNGSVDAHVSSYIMSPDFLALAKNTRGARSRLLKRFADMRRKGRRVGDLPLDRMEEQHVRELIADLTPEVRRVMVQALRNMIEQRIAAGGDLSRNVVGAVRVRTTPKGKKKPGRHTWTPDEIAAFRKRWPKGTDARLAMDLLLLTGQRRGDAIRMGWDLVSDRVLTVVQEKTGALAHIPVQDELFEVVRGLPLGAPWLRNAHGHAWASGGAFGSRFADWCDAAKLPARCRAHGLRKAFCCFWAEKGFSQHQIAAMSGHLTLEEVARYTEAADRLKIVQAMLAEVG